MEIEKFRARRSSHRGWAIRICGSIHTILTSDSRTPETLADLSFYESKLRERQSLLGELDEEVIDLSHMSRGFYGIDQSATSAQGLEYTIRALP